MKLTPKTNTVTNTNTTTALIFTTLSLTSLTLLSGLALSSSLVSADDNTSVVDEINITVPVSCTLSGTGMNTHNADIANGTSNSNIGETTLKAFCNDNEGFAIYAIGYTDNEEGKNVLTNSTLGDTYDIATGTATSGTDSSWAMKLATVSSPTPTYPIIIAGTSDDTQKEQGDPDYSTFQQVPDDYTKVAYRTSNTDIGTSAEGSTLTTTYQAYISPTQPAGTYTGQVKYTLVHPHTATAPIKPIACNPSGTTISTVVCMQDINSNNKASILVSMTEDQQYQLYDARDGKQYYIAKLKDGNIWMTQNLDHDIKTDGSVIYDNTTTDLGWNTLTNSYDVATWTPIHSAYTHDSTSEYGWGQYGEEFEELYPEEYPSSSIGSLTYPESFDPGDSYWNGEIYDYDNYYVPQDFVSSSGDPHYHLGNYYSYPAAIAMNYYEDYSFSETVIEQSVCPAGWTLPKAGSEWGDVENDFFNLIQSYDSSFIGYGEISNLNPFSAPTYFILGGHPANSLYGVGDYGKYISSVNWMDSDYCYNINGLSFGSTNVNIYGPLSDDAGFVRCIAR